jgi:hypothetical protein
MILNKKILSKPFIILFFTVFIDACVHDTSKETSNLFTESTSFSSEGTSISPLLKLSQEDLAPYLTNTDSPIWWPFLLPQTSQLVVDQSDFFAGYLNNESKWIAPPQKGECALLSFPKKDQEKKKEIIFQSQNNDKTKVNGDLIFLMDKDSLLPFAVIKLNEKGEAKCSLPQKSFSLSYQYGSLRKDFSFPVDNQTNLVFIPSIRKGIVHITPSPSNNILNGDLIRIGKHLSDQDKQLDLDEDSIPIQIDEDLYHPANSMSQKMGIDEVLSGSLMVGTTPFQFRMNKGTYFFAVIRKNHVICNRELSIDENTPVQLNCPKMMEQDEEEKILTNDAQKLYFDNTFYPKSIRENPNFILWILSDPSHLMPKLMLTEKPSLLKDEKAEVSKNNPPLSWQFLTLPPNSGIRKLNKIYSFPINEKNSPFPIWQTGMEEIAQGAIPYLNYSSMILSKPFDFQKLFSTRSSMNGTNGASIKIFEPILNQEGSLSTSYDQRFRFRITIPPWNSTNVVEMDVDGKLIRRWILNRGDLSKPFSMTLSEKTSEIKPFHVQFFSWGQESLPDFIYGAEEEKPYQQTQIFPVVITGS